MTNVQFSPDNWLKHGEILNLTVTCNGSNPFHYCFKIYEGEYNTTGNESCIELVKSGNFIYPNIKIALKLFDS